MRTIAACFILLLAGCTSAKPTRETEPTLVSIHMVGSKEEIAQFRGFYDECAAELATPVKDSQEWCPTGQVCQKAGSTESTSGPALQRRWSEMSERCKNLRMDVEQPCAAIEQVRLNGNRKSFYTISELNARCESSDVTAHRNWISRKEGQQTLEQLETYREQLEK
jgi:hypothetical protein